MNKYIILFIVIFPLFSLISCTDSKEDVEETLSVSADPLNFKASGGKQTFTIKSDTQWTISTESNTWCKLSSKAGNGDMVITVEVFENTKETTRSLKLIVKTSTSTKSETVNVNQEAAAPVEEPDKLYFPLITIKTENNKPITSKVDYVNAVITIESRDGKGLVVEKLQEAETEIRGRGNSTWGMEKKPYRLKLNKSSEMLGMPKNKHWVLLANYSDKTLMRNELAFEISRRMEFAYTPRTKYVDVVLNGDYIGNYMLCEHIRIDKNRVNIAEMGPSDTDITGGYLLEIDERKGEPVWFETQEAKMIFCVSRPEDIPANQKEYIKNHIQKIEDILYGKNGVDVVNELPKYLDIKSFIDYFLLNEISKNVDGNLRLSTFVYKNRNDDKLYFGPVWDYDIAFGNVNYDGCEITSGWHMRNTPWCQKFFSHTQFSEMVKNRWKELRAGELNDLYSFIDQLAEEMETSQKANFNRWKILSKAVWPNPVVTGSYKGEVNYLKNWLKERETWMDKQLQ